MSFREKYFSDCRAETTLHPNGKGYKVEYVYCGDWYCWDLAKPDFLRFKGAMLLLCGAELVVYAICALQYAPANTSPIVAAGGLLAIIAQIFQWIGLVQLCLSRRKVKDRDCHEIWAKLRLGRARRCWRLPPVAAFCGKAGCWLPGTRWMRCWLMRCIAKSRGLHFLCCPATEALSLRIEHFAAFRV